MIHMVLPFIAMFTLSCAVEPISRSNPLLTLETCQKISSSISSSSDVYLFGSIEYFEDISHWALSSTQTSVCSFEPGTPEDVGIALQILGETQTPFAVKGGGHTANPGFSSTSGIQVAMTRFSEVVYDSAANTVTVGAGLTWDTVYEELEPYGVNVAGGRVPGVGVAGFALGGYSWHTSQRGLTFDTVTAFQLVLSNGTTINATETSYPDLFFGLKGGLNNFGIVVGFTLKTFPQPQVWGGLITYTADVLDQVNLATANFAATNTDSKAAILTNYNSILGVPGASVVLFYDGSTPPPGTFEEFLKIPSFTRDITTRSFHSFVKSIPGIFGTRFISHSISVTNFTFSFIESVVNEVTVRHWGEQLSSKTGFFYTYDVEPLLPTLFTHSTSPSAYPPDRTKGVFPLRIAFSWTLPDDDDDFHNAVRTSAGTLQAAAVAGGIASTAVYPNYAIYDTPLVNLYGDNLPRLQAIKEAADPSNVMGLAGGFKVS